MPSLVQLPLDNIVEALCLHCLDRDGWQVSNQSSPDELDRNELSALWALSLTSKQIHAVANARLYHRPSYSRWWLLLQTLLDRPDLRDHVKCFYHRGDYPAAPEYHRPALIVSLERFVDGITQDQPGRERAPTDVFPMNLFPKYFHYTRTGRKARLLKLEQIFTSPQGLFDVLTVMLPRLQTLHFEPTKYTRADWPLPLQSMAQLSTLILQPITDGSSTEFNLLLETSRLKPRNLTSLAASHVSRCSTPDPSYPHLTKLHLKRCALDALNLRNLLHACPNLKEFGYSATLLRFGAAHFTPRQAQDALVELQPKLETLRLEMAEAVPAPSFRGANEPRFSVAEVFASSSPINLPSLESLHLSVRCLVPLLCPLYLYKSRAVYAIYGTPLFPPPGSPGYYFPETMLTNVLPATVRSFRLDFSWYYTADVAPRLLGALEYLAAVAEARLPKLESVALVGLDTSSVVLEPVQAAFRENGLRFEVVEGEAMYYEEEPFQKPTPSTAYGVVRFAISM